MGGLQIVEAQGAVDWVTLNRPEQLNTLNPQLLRELNDYFAALERNYAVRVVVLRGAGGAFSAGGSLGGTAIRVQNGQNPGRAWVGCYRCCQQPCRRTLPAQGWNCSTGTSLGWASSRPVGSPEASRWISPPGGLGVSLV